MTPTNSYVGRHRHRLREGYRDPDQLAQLIEVRQQLGDLKRAQVAAWLQARLLGSVLGHCGQSRG